MVSLSDAQCLTKGAPELNFARCCAGIALSGTEMTILQSATLSDGRFAFKLLYLNILKKFYV